MNSNPSTSWKFSDQPPSTQWAALKFRGEKLADVWFKPEGEPFGVTFRIPQRSFQLPAMAQQLTPEKLLKAVGISPEEIESWRRGDVAESGMNGSDAELGTPLQAPAPEIPYLGIHIRLKPPVQGADPDKSSQAKEAASPDAVRSESGAIEKPAESSPSNEGSQTEATTSGAEAGSDTPEMEKAPSNTTTPSDGSEPETAEQKYWQDLKGIWRAIIGLEGAIDNLRVSMNGLLSEMESCLRKQLTTEEKVHALRADIADWSTAKSRIHYAMPKVREFIHRATWAAGAPERKHLDALYKNHIDPQIPGPEMDKALPLLETVQKQRQVLSAHGSMVYNECKNICSEVERALRTLQSNAAAKERDARKASGAKGKFFKHVRKWSGAE